MHSTRPEGVLHITEETDAWLALFKPAGLSVFPRHTDPGSDCLLRRLLAARPDQDRADWPEGFAGGLAHRLDIPTSGMVLAARTPDALRWLRGLFSEKRLVKTYHLLTAKDAPWDRRAVAADIAHDRRRKKRMVVRRGQNTPHRGRWYPARTRFRRLAAIRDGFGRWEATMRTGVMHQIRVHAGFIGLALAGDRLYGGGPTPDDFPVPFALHHCGLIGPKISPRPISTPEWWADCPDAP